MKEQKRKSMLKRVIICFIAFVMLLATLIFYYEELHIRIADVKTSPDEEYTLVLQEIGTASWPFGSAKGRILLKHEDNIIERYDIEIFIDGGCLDEYAWEVAWHPDYVEISIYGEAPETLVLYYDNK